MSTAIFVIALLILLVGVNWRVERRRDFAHDLEIVERERNEAEFWGFSTEAEGRRKKERLEGGDWKNTLRFEIVCWGLYIVGGFLLVIGTVMWLDEDQNHTWTELAKFTGFAVLAMLAVWFVYRMEQKLENTERAIGEIKLRLKAVKDHAENMRKGSIDNFVELRDRLDKLDGKKYQHENDN